MGGRVSANYKLGKSFQAAALASSIIVTILPAWAASDEELAQKCVAGYKAVSGAEITYLSGGSLEGLLHKGSTNITIRGTWEVRNGVLTVHSQAEGGGQRINSFPIRMDDAGKCYINHGGTETLMEK